jgi:hypothetical protein
MGLLEELAVRCEAATGAEHQAGLRNLYLLQTDNARMAKALRAYVDAYDAGTGTVYVNRQIREALGLKTDINALALPKGSEG